jgi:hypothetical protein
MKKPLLLVIIVLVLCLATAVGIVYARQKALHQREIDALHAEGLKIMRTERYMLAHPPADRRVPHPVGRWVQMDDAEARLRDVNRRYMDACRRYGANPSTGEIP